MGRLTLNVLLSFAQFEREVTGERIRDKVAASKKNGIGMGGHVPLGDTTWQTGSSSSTRRKRKLSVTSSWDTSSGDASDCFTRTSRIPESGVSSGSLQLEGSLDERYFRAALSTICSTIQSISARRRIRESYTRVNMSRS
jgi:hypothetical protein